MYIHFIGSLKLSEIQTKPSELQITQIFLKLCTTVSLSFDSFQTVALRVMKRCICMPKGKKPRWNNKRAMNISAVCWVSIFFRFFPRWQRHRLRSLFFQLFFNGLRFQLIAWFYLHNREKHFTMYVFIEVCICCHFDQVFFLPKIEWIVFVCYVSIPYEMHFVVQKQTVCELRLCLLFSSSFAGRCKFIFV